MTILADFAPSDAQRLPLHGVDLTIQLDCDLVRAQNDPPHGRFDELTIGFALRWMLVGIVDRRLGLCKRGTPAFERAHQPRLGSKCAENAGLDGRCRHAQGACRGMLCTALYQGTSDVVEIATTSFLRVRRRHRASIRIEQLACE